MPKSDEHREKADEARRKYQRVCDTMTGLAALSDLLRQQTPQVQEREARPSIPPDEDWADAATG